jgi:hypothetical protein
VIPIISEKTAREGENKIINARIVVVNLLNLILLEVIPKKGSMFNHVCKWEEKKVFLQ